MTPAETAARRGGLPGRSTAAELQDEAGYRDKPQAGALGEAIARNSMTEIARRRVGDGSFARLVFLVATVSPFRSNPRRELRSSIIQSIRSRNRSCNGFALT